MDGVVSLLFFFLRLYMSPSFFICFLDYIYLGAQKDGVSSGQWDIWDEPHGKLNLGLGFLIGLDWIGLERGFDGPGIFTDGLAMGA